MSDGPISIVRDKADPSLVEVVRELLQRVEAGEIVSLSGDSAGAIAACQHRLMTRHLDT